MFSNGWGSSISLETVTPSLVIRGLPKDFCRHDVASAGAERGLDRAGKLRQAVADFSPGVGVEFHLFSCHDFCFLITDFLFQHAENI